MAATRARLSWASCATMLARPAHHDQTGGLPLSAKQPTPTTRKDRRAAERRDRFEAARDQRRGRAGSSGGGGSSFINTKTMTIAGIVVGVLIVAIVAVGQLGDRGRVVDPGFAYDAASVDGSALGTEDAPVLLEVFEDYQCPVCARYALEVEPTIFSKYVKTGRVRIVHHDISILGGGGPTSASDESTITAKGAYCAEEQDRYWPYAHWIYQNQDGENRGGFRRERVTEIAASAGLDEAAFTSCLDSAEATASVVESTQMAVGLTINSTPTLRLNGGELIRSLLSVAELSARIDAELAKAGGASPSGSPAASPSTAP